MESRSPRDLYVRVTKDNLAVLLDCVILSDDIDRLAELVGVELASLRIANPPNREHLVAWLREKAATGPRITNAVLLEGQPPVQPEDGVIEWADRFFDSGFVLSEKTGAIDYRQHLAQRSVAGGQPLATVIPPKEGQDGVNVFGKPIPVSKPKTPRIRAGQNVREEGGRFYAKTDGRIRWDSEGLSVDKVYRIEGNVGLETGNIRHPGALEVGKDIEEGMRVKADGDIEVEQVVEPADVESGGNLTVRGGIAGGPGWRIRAKGSVHAKYVLEADIEAGQDVVVEREIFHSTVKTQGTVRVPNGRLTGGTTIALGGIHAGQTGSVALVRTVLVVGEDFAVMAEVAQREERIAVLEKYLASLYAGPFPLKIDKTKRTLQELRDEIDEIRARSKERAREIVAVRDIMHPETVIRMGQKELRIGREVRGPVKAVLVEGEIVLLTPND